MLRRLLPLLVLSSLVGFASARADEPMLRFLWQGAALEGQPLYWEGSFGAVLARDGRWLQVDPRRAENVRRVSSSFRPFPAMELRTLLQQEFGPAYEVTGDVHYLVVHPKGERTAWAPRFEQLYRAFQHYFTARGWRPREPRFPLVAVVFPDEPRFRDYARREGSQVSPNTLGYYSPLSNRILLYDAAATTGEDWSVNAETIIHEAAHQTAFNTGVHNRFAQPPRWVVEGLGTLFEARGVWDSARYRQRTDRVNRGRFESFQRYAKQRRPSGALAELVASDRPFEADIDGAYAEAWALTFFLSETDPRGYLAYLKKTADQPHFTRRSEAERLADFTSVFGSNLKLLEAKLLRFLAETR